MNDREEYFEGFPRIDREEYFEVQHSGGFPTTFLLVFSDGYFLTDIPEVGIINEKILTVYSEGFLTVFNGI